MNIYTVYNEDITLELMGRKRTFKVGEKINSNAYTEAYPEYFKKIGKIEGLLNSLASPVFISDIEEDFVSKEAERKKNSRKRKLSKKKEVDINEISLDEFEEPTIKTK